LNWFYLPTHFIMKSDYYACVTFHSSVFCNECCPVPLEHKEVQPVFANSEWMHTLTCDRCGEEHDYMTILKEEPDTEECKGCNNNIDFCECSQSAHTPAPIYYVSTCPDTGKQFLVEEGKDNNIIELTKDSVKKIAAAPIGYLMAESAIKLWHDDDSNMEMEEPEYIKYARRFLAKARGE